MHFLPDSEILDGYLIFLFISWAWHGVLNKCLLSKWILTFESGNWIPSYYLTKQLLSQGLIDQPILYAKAKITYSRIKVRVSLMVQGLRICLAMWGILVPPLVQADLTGLGATKPAPQLLSPRSWGGEPQLLKPMCPRAWALQQRQALAMRSSCPTAGEQPPLTTTREKLSGNEDPAQPKIKKIKERK